MSHITRVEWIQCVSTCSHHLLLLRQDSSKQYTFFSFLADSNGTCHIYPMQLHTNCKINLNGENKDFETSKVPGFVTFIQENLNITLCTEAKEVVVYNG